MNFGGRYKDLIQPDKLHVLSLSILIDSLTNSRSGTAVNIAYNLALLREQPILLASVGKDAADYLSELAGLGIDVSRVHQTDLPTPTFTVLTDLDDNQIGGFYPGAMADISHLTLEPWYDTKSLVVISANDPTGMAQLVAEYVDHHLDYAYNVGQQVTNISVQQLKAGLTHASILLVNDYELGVIQNRTGYTNAELSRMIPLVVTTLGKTGTGIGETITPAVQDVQVVDPTGAGDAYRAGFLFGYLRHLDPSLCAQLGSVMATYTIERHGTQTHTPSVADIQQKLYTAYGTKINLLET
jgi:adenosine kinase